MDAVILAYIVDVKLEFSFVQFRAHFFLLLLFTLYMRISLTSVNKNRFKT